MSKAFRFDGPIWETGYPRNDLLVGRDAPAARQATREELGVQPDEVVVLYAPTWRDDVLVTDYSSVMFDFALTGKPMVFYAYDLDRFRDEIRGFYFDLVPQAPGPVVRTEEDLVEALLHPEPERYAERYATFCATFGHLEDGHATDRVLERLGL
jgi:CDP-glycerol glycerophosphotransferase